MTLTLAETMRADSVSTPVVSVSNTASVSYQVMAEG
jgi:hypothetical protein